MDPESSEIIKGLNNLHPALAGVLMAIFMSILRVIYDQHETKPIRMIMESLICGGLTLAVTAGIEALGLSSSWDIFAGGVIGFFGAHTIRSVSLKLIEKKTAND